MVLPYSEIQRIKLRKGKMGAFELSIFPKGEAKPLQLFANPKNKRNGEDLINWLSHRMESQNQSS